MFQVAMLNKINSVFLLFCCLKWDDFQLQEVDQSKVEEAFFPTSASSSEGDQSNTKKGCSNIQGMMTPTDALFQWREIHTLRGLLFWSPSLALLFYPVLPTQSGAPFSVSCPTCCSASCPLPDLLCATHRTCVVHMLKGWPTYCWLPNACIPVT